MDHTWLWVSIIALGVSNLFLSIRLNKLEDKCDSKSSNKALESREAIDKWLENKD